MVRINYTIGNLLETAEKNSECTCGRDEEGSN